MLIALVAVSVLAVVAIIGWLADRRAIGKRAQQAESERDVKASELSRSEEKLSLAHQDIADNRKTLATVRAELESSRTLASDEARRADHADQARRSAEALLEINRRSVEELTERDRQLREARRHLDEGLNKVERDRLELVERSSRLDDREAELDRRHGQIVTDLERVAGMSLEQARDELADRLGAEARIVADNSARAIVSEAIASAEAKARHIVAEVIQRCSSEMVADTVVSVVPLPSDEMKGRVIGREGRNIRTFEQVTGVTVIIDDTPGIVLLSCFDPMRREVARQALTDLVEDGRIHPISIEKAHQRAVDRIEDMCLDAAADAVSKAGIGDIDDRLLPILGSLRFRTSYGQQVLDHCVECARLAANLAAEIGADVEVCRRAAFLHDLGKSLTPGIEGSSHAAIGAELARRYGESEEVIHAIAAHHDEIDPVSVTDLIVKAADAISAARPGARRDSLEAHVRRMDTIEEIATGFPGVERAFALQAGREVQILVDPGTVDDVQASRLARQIAIAIGEQVTVPGRTRVTVIRSFQAVETVG
ncbi:ribonuclease Y [Cutibacterium sp. WCA-380-WT-3A]|uniref:Ribonuclease Y n=1 Tax=Cutibacterium porci TaxID=2605781 RepID=A0A7K0J6R3_9ACTN|nr:ribonuclease Y [Cutibacterium porci]MSS45637.1 ribonuclease Y [Cutibacterium porci]